MSRLMRARAGGRHAVLVAVSLLLAGLGGGLYARDAAPRAGSSSPAATPTVDPRLILRARTLRIAEALPGGLRLVGTLYPTLPGPNTLRVAVRQRSRAPLQGGRVSLVATMPGMAMAPARATLRWHNNGYTGTLRLPMLGRYRVQVVVDAPAGRSTGTVVIALLPPQW
jgi:hypothetical protein